MNVDDASAKFRDKKWRQQTHKPRETNEVYFAIAEFGDDEAIVRLAFEAARYDYARRNSSSVCRGNSRRVFAIADYDRDFSVWNSMRSDGIGERYEIRAASAEQNSDAL